MELLLLFIRQDAPRNLLKVTLTLWSPNDVKDHFDVLFGRVAKRQRRRSWEKNGTRVLCPSCLRSQTPQSAPTSNSMLLLLASSSSLAACCPPF